MIGLCLLVPTLVIGFWPRVAIDLYEASTTALATDLAAHSAVQIAAHPAGQQLAAAASEALLALGRLPPRLSRAWLSGWAGMVAATTSPLRR